MCVKSSQLTTSKLGDVHVFKLSTVMEALKLCLPDGASQHHSGAFLCLHKIPASSVCSIERTSEIQRCKGTRVELCPGVDVHSMTKRTILGPRRVYSSQ